MKTNALLPKNWRSPLADSRRVNKGVRRCRTAIQNTQQWLIEQWDSVPVREYEARTSNSRVTVNVTRYEYQISIDVLNQLIGQINERLRAEMGDAVVAESLAGYEVGTSNTVEVLAGITDDYQRTVDQVLISSQYLQRAAFLRARVFDQMKGFEGQTAADLGRVLYDAIENGISPLDVTKRIRARFGVSRSRAERIARTEIAGAQRRGNWDESQDAEERLGVITKQMHLSALLPTSRRTHIQRHGNLYTLDEVRDWYTQDGNAINCRCSQVPVRVDESGDPLNPRGQQKAKEVRKRLGYG